MHADGLDERFGFFWQWVACRFSCTRPGIIHVHAFNSPLESWLTGQTSRPLTADRQAQQFQLFITKGHNRFNLHCDAGRNQRGGQSY
jgi:hypothetical protein